MPCTVGKILEIIDGFAPFDTAMSWDNAGLLIGKKENEVTGILCALDATPEVAREAKTLGAQLLVTHHPVMFRPIQRLDEENPEAETICELIRNGVSLIAAHTNFDAAPGGVGESLASQVGWQVTEKEDVLCLGSLPETGLAQLEKHVSRALNAPVVRYGGGDEKRVTRFALCSGAAGEEEALEALRRGAQVLLTGEMKHNELLAACARGLTVLCAGHRATEICAAQSMAGHLQIALNRLQLNVRLFVSRIDPFV